ncbi:MAG: hypothetical protein PVG23_02580 [Nitrosopumilaceae archaeon]|jgi:hypothetical protein
MQTVQENIEFLERYGYKNHKRARKALNLLLINRRVEFRTIADGLLTKIDGPINVSEWDEFILRTCLEVEECFTKWQKPEENSLNSHLKSFVILSQFSKGKSSMNHMTQYLNLAYSLAKEFKIIYKKTD